MVEILGVAALVAMVVWLLRPGARRAGAAEPREPVDTEELEAAEREVQDLDLHQRPEDGFTGDDWGPGASPHRPP